MHPARDVGTILNEIRTRTGLDKQGLARLGPVHPSLISRWTAGKTRPDYERLRLVADGVRRQHPDLADLADELFTAAGYSNQPEPPDLVRENWSDAAVREIWRNRRIPAAERESLIVEYLAAAAGLTDREREVLRASPSAFRRLVEERGKVQQG